MEIGTQVSQMQLSCPDSHPNRSCSLSAFTSNRHHVQNPRKSSVWNLKWVLFQGSFFSVCLQGHSLAPVPMGGGVDLAVGPFELKAEPVFFLHLPWTCKKSHCLLRGGELLLEEDWPAFSFLHVVKKMVLPLGTSGMSITRGGRSWNGSKPPILPCGQLEAWAAFALCREQWIQNQ